MPSPSPPGQKDLPPFGYIGIDFGTCNTHIAICYLDGNNVPQTLPLAGEASVPTCLLCREPCEGKDDDESNVLAFGTKALQTWLILSEADRTCRRLAAGFKPDIVGGHRSSAARREARAFLRKCYQAVRDGNMVRAVGKQEGMPVVVGVPAEVGREQKEVTRRLVEDSGFGEAVDIDEPLGALAFHLADGSVTAAEVRKGVVVVDFGGGTFDVALLDARHGLSTPWGDPTLGGRLFDDLFYLWLLEQNPGLDLSERDQWYVWQVVCRQLKERFSNHWKAEGPDAEFVDEMKLPGRGRYAEFRCAGATEFFARAGRYTPSQPATRYFAEVGGKLAELGGSGPVDLIGWVRRELERKGRPPGIARVILTGGSSNWPFIRDLAADIFGVESKQILLSPHPEVTIGSGLAVYRVLEYRNAQKRVKLLEELPGYQRTFEEAVTRQMEQFTRRAAAAVVAPVIAHVEGVYLDWYRNGGTLRSVSQKVQSFTRGFDVKVHLQGQDALLAKDLVRLLRDHLAVWLKEHGIERDVDELVPEGGVVMHVLPIGDHAQDIAANISTMAGVTLVGAIFAIVYIAAHGAHILVHPWTGVPTAAVSAALAALGFNALEDYLRSWLMGYEWGPVSLGALSVRLSEQNLRDKITQSRQEMIRDISGLLSKGPECTTDACTSGQPVSKPKWQTLDELKVVVVAQFVQVVEQVIKDLGVLEEIRKAGK
ncbi:MAG: Molecular chaperone-like protein [Gemmataceae bacterium]|nr:Molecular chaperone-like protein [Gemmataceae bacterium]